MSLFELGDFTLHSGQKSSWIINCHELSDADIEALAHIAATEVLGGRKFYNVTGIPRGGVRFAEALTPLVLDAAAARQLIVDDVFTTGASMEAERLRRMDSGFHPLGVVLFARRETPWWISPLLRLG